MSPEIALTSGLLLGLAGSAHCACLCGGIASSLMLATSPAIPRGRSLLALHLGRLTAYAAAGALVGGASGSFATLLQLSGGQLALRMLTALSLVWAGLSVIGVVPAFRPFRGRLPSLSAHLSPSFARPLGAAFPVVAGFCWGLAPCAMVYNALMTAMLSGDFASGALFMAAFGLATVPAVAAVAAGAGFMARRGTSRAGLFRPAAGSTLVALGVLSALFPQAFLSGLCLT